MDPRSFFLESWNLGSWTREVFLEAWNLGPRPWIREVFLESWNLGSWTQTLDPRSFSRSLESWILDPDLGPKKFFLESWILDPDLGSKKFFLEAWNLGSWTQTLDPRSFSRSLDLGPRPWIQEVFLESWILDPERLQTFANATVCKYIFGIYTYGTPEQRFLEGPNYWKIPRKVAEGRSRGGGTIYIYIYIKL